MGMAASGSGDRCELVSGEVGARPGQHVAQGLWWALIVVVLCSKRLVAARDRELTVGRPWRLGGELGADARACTRNGRSWSLLLMRVDGGGGTSLDLWAQMPEE